MDFEHGDDQLAILSSVSALLAQHAGPARAIELGAKDGYDAELDAALRKAGFTGVALGDGTGPLEAALIASRSDVTLAESVLDKTRIRSPIDGTVLQINAKVGELVAPSLELPLIVMGDMTIVRVRAEVDEADVSKIKRDQRVFVRNTAHPNRDFEGKVVELAPSLAMPRMGSRGARRATDVEVMEVVDGSPAAHAGIRSGDLIVEMDGTAVADARDLQRLMVGERIGQTVGVLLWRDGELRTLELHPIELTAA